MFVIDSCCCPAAIVLKVAAVCKKNLKLTTYNL
jgi:hypothetical protein